MLLKGPTDENFGADLSVWNRDVPVQQSTFDSIKP